MISKMKSEQNSFVFPPIPNAFPCWNQKLSTISSTYCNEKQVKSFVVYYIDCLFFRILLIWQAVKEPPKLGHRVSKTSDFNQASAPNHVDT